MVATAFALIVVVATAAAAIGLVLTLERGFYMLRDARGHTVEDVPDPEDYHRED